MAMSEVQVVEAIGGEKIDTGTTSMVKAAMAVIPSGDKLLVPAQWNPIKEQLQKASEKAVLVTVESETDYATAETYARLLNPVVKKVENKRLDLTREIKARLIDPINNAMSPVIKTAKAAVDHLNGQCRQYRQKQIDEQREAQRKADAEAARRQKLQDAAVARGGTARQEIVASEIPKPEAVVSDRSAYFRLTYEIEDEAAIPRQFCKPDPGLIRARVVEMEKGFEKDQKGFADVPQDIPGVKIKWEQYFRR